MTEGESFGSVATQRENPAIPAAARCKIVVHVVLVRRLAAVDRIFAEQQVLLACLVGLISKYNKGLGFPTLASLIFKVSIHGSYQPSTSKWGPSGLSYSLFLSGFN